MDVTVINCGLDEWNWSPGRSDGISVLLITIKTT